MKKIAYVMVAAAAVFASACSKVDTQVPVAEPQDQASRFIFDVTVDGPDTRAVKTAWEEGDQFLIFFENDVTLGHQLRLTYNGSGWTGRFDDEQFAETFTAGSKGRIYGIHYPGTITATQVDGELRMRAPGTVIMSRSIDYSVSESDDRLKFSAALTTSLQTNMQIVVTGDDVNVDDSWTLESYYREYDNGVIGCDLNSCATCYFGGDKIGNYASYVVSGVQNADGIAFNFRYDYAGRGDVVLVLENSKKGKTYYRVIPEGKLPTQDQVTNGTGKAYKMALSSFVEQTENTGLVRDAAYHYYNTVKLKDGKTWMADNYRYVPEGMTPCSSLTNVAGGVYYPVVVNAEKTAAVLGTDEDAKTHGYIYQTEVALGLKVNDITSEEQAKALEGMRGICPEGWHIPTVADITGLVGKAVSPIVTNAAAPYYNGANGSILMLKEDGFDMMPSGYVAILDNTRTSGTASGLLKNYDFITSGYFIGSSFAAITYMTAGDASSGIKNVQFYGLMPMANKATEAEYTCNGSKLSYKIAASVRCVKD